VGTKGTEAVRADDSAASGCCAADTRAPKGGDTSCGMRATCEIAWHVSQRAHCSCKDGIRGIGGVNERFEASRGES
jgi:hypothetical protein